MTVLFEGDGFDWFSFLESESLTVIIVFAMLAERNFRLLGVIESGSFQVLVSLSPNSSRLFFAFASNLDFEVSNHLNDHYYNSTIYSLHQKFIKSYYGSS